MTGRSTCPECSTILRIRDQSFIGRRVNCPECNTVLRVESPDRDGNFALRRLTVDELKAARKKREQTTTPQQLVDDATPVKKKSLSLLLNSKATVACLLLVGLVALVAVVSFKSSSRTVASRPVKTSTDVTNPVVSDPVNSPNETPVASDIPPSPAPPETVRPNETPIELTLVEEIPPVSAVEPQNYDQPYPWEAEPASTTTISSAPAKVDVEGKLSLKILSYKQPKVARKDLIEALEEQLGAPIRYDKDELGQEGLDEKISFDLQNTTIGGVIEKVAQTAGWQMRIEDTGLRLSRSPASSQP